MWTGGLFWGVLGRMGRVYKAKRKNVTWLATHGCGESAVVWRYSVSFDFTQLRFCPRGLHTARQAAADTRSSAEEPARCAKRYATAHARRRLSNNARGGNGQRRSGQRSRLESAALSSKILRERHANDARHHHKIVCASGCAAYGVQIRVRHRRGEVCRRGWLASHLAAHEE